MPWRRSIRDAIVIGSDQVASLETDGRPCSCCTNPATATPAAGSSPPCRAIRARFDTAVAVVHAGTVITHWTCTQVQFRVLDAATIESYMDREPSFDCAGGFKCEGLGVTLFESIEIRDPTALIGLPLIGLCAALRQLGVPV